MESGLDMATRKRLTNKSGTEHAKDTKKQKREILDRLESMGTARSTARRMLKAFADPRPAKTRQARPQAALLVVAGPGDVGAVVAAVCFVKFERTVLFMEIVALANDVHISAVIIILAIYLLNQSVKRSELRHSTYTL